MTVEGPQAVLVSNNLYGMGDIAGLGRRARMDRGTLGIFAVTVASAVQALVLDTPVRCRIQPLALRVRVPRDRPGVPDAKPQIDWKRLWQMALTVPGTGRATPHDG